MTADVRAKSEPGAPMGRGRRRWVNVLVWLLVAPFAVWIVLRLIPGDVHFRWVQLVGFTPYVGVASVVPLIVALVSRRWVALAVSVVVSAAFAVCVGPRALPGPVPEGSASSLRVLAANLSVGAVPPAALVKLVRELRPDVLALQELTPEAARGLEGAGLGRLLPYAMDRSRPGVGGSAVMARFPVTAKSILDYGGFGQAQASVAVPGTGGVDVVSVHPCAPRHPVSHRCWSQGLTALPPPTGALRVLAGDFNATLDHAPMRAMLAEGYQDAADATGTGLSTTWPYLRWDFNGLSIPRVAIDHIFTSPRLTARSFSVHALPATDHRAVFAELALPRRSD